MTSLKEVINKLVAEVLLQEKLRGTFNFTEFKNLSKTADSEKLYEYLLGTLGKPIGEGSSRTVWVLSSNKVLKLAYDQSWINKPGAGLAQNKVEAEIATHPKVKHVVATVYDIDPNFKWIISELTHPLTKQKVESIIGIDKTEFEKLLKEILWYRKPLNQALNDAIRNAEDMVRYYKLYPNRTTEAEFYQKLAEQYKNINLKLLKPTVDGILAMKDEFGFNVDDLARYDHYGRTADGRLVVIDYGFTSDIGRTFY